MPIIFAYIQTSKYTFIINHSYNFNINNIIINIIIIIIKFEIIKQ